MTDKYNWLWWRILIIATRVSLGEASSIDFYSMCENTETFVSLTDQVSVIIDGQNANVPVCSMKLTAAQRDTRLRYVFKETSLISKDVALLVAAGVDDILWTKALFNFVMPPKVEKLYQADEQLKFTVNRLNGAEFYLHIEITADERSSSEFELSEWAIVGIVFGSLVFVNILAIIIGLAYRQTKKLKKINSVGSLEETQPTCKQDNAIVRNTLSSRSNDERDFSRPSTADDTRLFRPFSKNGPTPPLGLVAQYLTAQRPSVREIPIANRGRPNYYNNNRTIFNITGKSQLHS